MKTITKKQIILTLIKNDLRNAKLVHGLNALGLEAHGYFLDTSTDVLRLMGYQKQHITDELHALYQDQLARAQHLHDAENIHELADMAVEMYAGLKFRIKMQEPGAKAVSK